MNSHFTRTAPARVMRSVFDLSHEKKLTADMGYLYPVCYEDCIPGDVFRIGVDLVVRMMPLVAPVLHEINAYVHYFFVPYRILWDDWETFITGGVSGTDATAIPVWNPTDTAVGSLWDYFGMPTGVDPDGFYPVQFLINAYNMIWNEYYRDENIQTAVNLDDEALLQRCWEKDYFTSALLWQQRGTPPALPITGTTSAVWADATLVNGTPTGGLTTVVDGDTVDAHLYVNSATGRSNMKSWINGNTVDLSGASTFTVADLRLSIQVQRWMERNARCGVRYIEFLYAHYGKSPKDERLQRPEYIGGVKTPLVISEVLQTSGTEAGTPQGTMVGHGITAMRDFAGKYHVQEHGIILGLLSIMPVTLYQQGIDRQWVKSTRYDYYFPEFANLSEQSVKRGEIFASNVSAENNTEFGFAGRYDEYRTRRSTVHGLMRTTFDYWHISRQFVAAPELNSVFLTCSPRKDFFAVPASPGFVVSIGNKITAIRPMPQVADPGYMDH